MKPDSEPPAFTKTVLTGSAAEEALMQLHLRANEALDSVLMLHPRSENGRTIRQTIDPIRGVCITYADDYYEENLPQTQTGFAIFGRVGTKISSRGSIRMQKANGLGEFYGRGSSIAAVWFQNDFVTCTWDGRKALVPQRMQSISQRENNSPMMSLREAEGCEFNWGVDVDSSTYTDPMQDTLDRITAALDEMKKYLDAVRERREAMQAALLQDPSQQTRHPLYDLLRRFW